MYKTVFYDEDEKIRVFRYWSSKDGNLIMEIQFAGADEYPGPTDSNMCYDDPSSKYQQPPALEDEM